MNKKSVTKITFLLIGQAIILLLCFFFIQSVYYKNILPDKLAKLEYQPMRCVLIDKALESQEKIIKTYRARFIISYTKNKIPFKTTTYGNGLDNNFSPDKSRQEMLLQEFSVGDPYPCWVNPKRPYEAILILRHDWNSVFTLFMPALVFLIVIYAFTRTLLSLFLPKK